MLALTPAAVLMFRFDNPDALLTLLLVAGAYAVTRAVEVASSRWLTVAGAVVGFAFLTKMLQGFLVLPAFALVYLIAALASLRRRIAHLLLAGLAVLVAAAWWVAVVAVWPAGSRSYIGGSTNNSVLNLVFGYNGLSRLLGSGGSSGGSGGGTGSGTAGSGFGGATGLNRLFSSEMGSEISWLLPASARRARRPRVAHARSPPHESGARRADRVGRLARRDGPRVQLPEGHHPPVPHRRSRSGHRRPGGHRCS
jgi:4-amino-4-deoxy-L-arabinose transferase-like glycosyltransferase